MTKETDFTFSEVLVQLLRCGWEVRHATEGLIPSLALTRKGVVFHIDRYSKSPWDLFDVLMAYAERPKE